MKPLFLVSIITHLDFEISFHLEPSEPLSVEIN